LDLDDEYLVPLARIHHLLPERGIEFATKGGDFILADSDRGPCSWDRPVALVDRSDGAYLYWRFAPQASQIREMLFSNAFTGVIKIARYRSVATYNALIGDQGEHARQVLELAPSHLQPAGGPAGPPLTATEYDKLLLGTGYWSFKQCDPLASAEIDLTGRRPIDVFCAVTVDYRCPIISWHRRQALDRLAELSGPRVVLGRGRVFSPESFRSLMCLSRICVSPWGWGETCYRDYEALLAGCVLIKPRTDFIDSQLPLDDQHYVACRPDLSDLGERIREVLDDWPRHAERREGLRQYVLHARRLDVQADLWASSLARAVQRHHSPSVANAQAAGDKFVPQSLCLVR
jgi:hypothetical protein